MEAGRLCVLRQGRQREEGGGEDDRPVFFVLRFSFRFDGYSAVLRVLPFFFSFCVCGAPVAA